MFQPVKLESNAFQIKSGTKQARYSGGTKTVNRQFIKDDNSYQETVRQKAVAKGERMHRCALICHERNAARKSVFASHCLLELSHFTNYRIS